jgi:dimethylhistidine N-methyltransferase
MRSSEQSAVHEPRVSVDPSVLDTFAADVVGDLQREPKQLQARYLYDALGSSLFDAICRLPWYRITRSEGALLRRHASEIAAALSRRAADAALVELGCGNGEKLELLLAGMRRDADIAVHLIDISSAALKATRARIARFGRADVTAHEGTYEQGLESIRPFVQHHAGTLVLFLGSNIGNFDPPAAAALLRKIREPLAPGALLLLGADLVKPVEDLVLAYDDPLGVTAAFNKNLLIRINRDLGANFDVRAFSHRAIWNEREHRVEMHLVSERVQEVFLAAAGVRIHFAAGESIWTESSYKYTADTLRRLGTTHGFTVTKQWIDDEAKFALTLFEAN